MAILCIGIVCQYVKGDSKSNWPCFVLSYSLTRRLYVELISIDIPMPLGML